MGLPCLVQRATETCTKHTYLTTKQEMHRAVGLFVTGAPLLKIRMSQSGDCPSVQQSYYWKNRVNTKVVCMYIQQSII